MKSISAASILFSIFFASFAQAECNFTWITDRSETVGGYACNQSGTHYDDQNVCRAQCGKTEDTNEVAPTPVRKCSTEYIIKIRGERRLCYRKISTGDGYYFLMLSTNMGCSVACPEKQAQ